MAQNLWWAAGYNVVAIPLAAGAFRLTELAGEIGVSESTVRRDLEFWQGQRLLKRIHGGAMFVGDGSTLPPLEERSAEHTGEKHCRCAKRSSFDGRVRGQSRLHRPLRVGPAVPVLLAVGALIGAGKRTFPRAQEHHGHTFRCC